MASTVPCHGPIFRTHTHTHSPRALGDHWLTIRKINTGLRWANTLRTKCGKWCGAHTHTYTAERERHFDDVQTLASNEFSIFFFQIQRINGWWRERKKMSRCGKNRTWQWTLPLPIWWEKCVRQSFFTVDSLGSSSAPQVAKWFATRRMKWARENNNIHFVQIKHKQKSSGSHRVFVVEWIFAVCLDDGGQLTAHASTIYSMQSVRRYGDRMHLRHRTRHDSHTRIRINWVSSEAGRLFRLWFRSLSRSHSAHPFHTCFII